MVILIAVIIVIIILIIVLCRNRGKIEGFGIADVAQQIKNWRMQVKNPVWWPTRIYDVQLLDYFVTLHKNIVADDPNVKNVAVAFTTPTCIHCINLRPIWNGIANANTDSRINYINTQIIDNNLNISAFPLIVVYDGKRLYKFNGARNAKNISEFSAYNL
jgi:hypothetical protein